MTSNPPASASGPEGQVPGAPAAAICKRPGCGNILPAGERGRARQFCGDACARRYHNDARVPVPAAAPADSPADPLAALDTVIPQAATAAARLEAENAVAALEQARRDAATQITAAQAGAAGQVAAAQAEAARYARERDDAAEAARR